MGATTPRRIEAPAARRLGSSDYIAPLAERRREGGLLAAPRPPPPQAAFLLRPPDDGARCYV
jgi:hypothetical protein